MNTPDPSHDPRWLDLVRRARADTPPAIDTAAVLREVRAAARSATEPWWTSLASLLDIRGAVPACIAAICLLAAVSFWQAWSAWDQVTPLAQVILLQDGPLSGGAL